MEVALRTMRPDEWEEFEQYALRQYASDMAALAGYDESSARQRAEEDHGRALSRGMQTPGEFFYAIECNGEVLGSLWFSVRSDSGTRYAYLVFVEVVESARGKGVGDAAMRALAAEVSRQGLAWIDLNVFGTNEIARGLYKKLGYRETFVRMRLMIGEGEG